MKKVLKIIGIILLVVIVIALCIFLFFMTEGYIDFKQAIKETPIKIKIEEIKSKDNYVLLSTLPQDYIDAIVAVEDRRFYYHNGIDLISIARAVLNDMKGKKLKEGGSTITQQLAKNTYFTQSKEIKRKFAEMFMAKELEKNLTKGEIMELYINTMYFGNGYYSVKEASKGYFGKEPQDMNFYDCTMLAGIPNAPSVYAPTNNVELAVQRQIQVLNKMLRYGYISQEIYDETVATPYPYHPNLTEKSKEN